MSTKPPANTKKSKSPPADTKDTSPTPKPPPKPPEKPAVKRGRPTKPPPPPKLWRIEGLSPDGMKVTLGRYVEREEAEPEFARLSEDGFYLKLKIIESPNPNPEAGTEAEAGP